MKRVRYLLSFFLAVALTAGVIGLFTDDVLQDVKLGLDLRGGFEILYEVEPLAEGQAITRDTLAATVAAIDRRVNVLGVAEPDIAIEGSNRIRVKLAGVFDQDKAREIIGKTAELRFVDVEGNVVMTGADLKENGAKPDFDQYNRPIVTLELKDAKKFEEITRQNIGKPLAIYLDNEMISSPTVQQVISGGTAMITGLESVEEARELADLLNAGALPVKLEEVFANTVGPRLGEKALEETIRAGVVGTALVVLFMIGFYRLPGIVSVIALAAYIFLILLTCTWMNATLTLPGIAGIILGIGMAVDANIITAERIKDELRAGKSILSALRSGTRRSLVTIIDANLTTILAAVVLFFIGTSAVQGFAITLIISILVSMLTAVFGSRLLINWLVRGGVGQTPGYFGVKERDIREL